MAVLVWTLSLAALVLLTGGWVEAGCVWYGQCGWSPDTGRALPCAYSGPARPLTDPHALKLLSQLCPTLTQGEPVDTCCDASQVEEFSQSMAISEQIFARCPSCMVNFANIYCQLTCSANQSAFLHADKVTAHHQVEAVTYAMSRTFANGMFQSCKDVRIPSNNAKALGLVCGRPADKCTVDDLLKYIGNSQNTGFSVSIHFIVTDHPVVLPDGTRLTPMNAPWWPCSRSPGKGRAPCSCQDCHEERCSLPMLPILPALPCGATYRQPSRGYNLVGKMRKRNTTSVYVDQYVIVHRKGNHSDIKHDLPPPSTSTVIFSPVFDLPFLHQVLETQEKLQNLTAATSGGQASYRDVCQRDDRGNCACSSPLDYFQGSGAKLDRVVKDSFGIYILADYMDHFLSCFSDPAAKNDSTALHMPCLSSTGQVTQPYLAFCGFSDRYYRLAPGLVLNLPIKDPDVSYAASVWRDKLRDFVETFQHQNVSLTYFQP